MKKSIKRPAVQLTSLLDLLFMMVFISLLQTKNVNSNQSVAKATPTPIPTSIPAPTKLPEKTSEVLRGIFRFYPLDNPQGDPRGSFQVQGSYFFAKKSFSLGGTQWIERPATFQLDDMRAAFLH